jgi:hypothetical protein
MTNITDARAVAGDLLANISLVKAALARLISADPRFPLLRLVTATARRRRNWLRFTRNVPRASWSLKT